MVNIELFTGDTNHTKFRIHPIRLSLDVDIFISQIIDKYIFSNIL